MATWLKKTGKSIGKAIPVGEAMPYPEFRRGILKLVNHWMNIWDAFKVCSAYMDADDECQRDLSDILRKDLAELPEKGA